MVDKTRIAFLEIYPELGAEVASFRKHNRRGNGNARPLRIGKGAGKHVLDSVLLHLLARNRREGVPHTPEEHSDIVVDFRRGSHGRAGIARVDLLLDGYRRRKAADEVAFRLGETPEELARIGRKALDIPSAPLGV